MMKTIDANPLFKERQDYYRAIFSVYEFNTDNPVVIKERRKVRRRIKNMIKTNKTKEENMKDPRDKIVNVVAFAFMPNHIHLLLKQVKEKGISNFIKKVAGGYAMYYNVKYKRAGYLFQNRFLSKLIEDDEQLIDTFDYIHANPVSLVEPGWKKEGVQNMEKVKNFLDEYKWSSFLDYIGKENFPSVTERKEYLEIFEEMAGGKDIKQNLYEWILYYKK